MAYTFNGTNQLLKLLNAGTLLGGYPFTIYARAKSANLTATQYVACYIRNSTTYNPLPRIALLGATGGDPVFANGVTSASVSYADGGWHSIAGGSASSTSHDVSADGVTTSGSSSQAWEGYAELQIGARLIPAFDLGLAGSACMVGLWDVALDANELASLHAGFSPRRVRPQSLRAYGPLVRELNAMVNKSGTMASFTATNAPTVSDHPRSYGF